MALELTVSKKELANARAATRITPAAQLPRSDSEHFAKLDQESKELDELNSCLELLKQLDSKMNYF